MFNFETVRLIIVRSCRTTGRYFTSFRTVGTCRTRFSCTHLSCFTVMSGKTWITTSFSFQRLVSTNLARCLNGRSLRCKESWLSNILPCSQRILRTVMSFFAWAIRGRTSCIRTIVTRITISAIFIVYGTGRVRVGSRSTRI